jgi:hypothetical protein
MLTSLSEGFTQDYGLRKLYKFKISYQRTSEDNYFDYKFKNVFYGPKLYHRSTRFFKFDGYDDPIKYTTDNLLFRKAGISIPRNNILYKLLKEKLVIFFEAGILGKNFSNIKNLERTNVDTTYVPYILERSSWDPLSMEHLNPGFVIWIISVLLTIIVFIFEVVFFNFAKMKLKQKFKMSKRRRRIKKHKQKKKKLFLKKNGKKKLKIEK